MSLLVVTMHQTSRICFENLEENVQNLYNQQHVYYFLSNEGSPQIPVIETGSEHSYQLESIEFDEKSVH